MGSSTPLPPYLALHISSTWLFLSCILNKPVISPYRFQHMGSVPGTYTCSRIEHCFIFHSHSLQWLQVITSHHSSHSIIQDTMWHLFIITQPAIIWIRTWIVSVIKIHLFKSHVCCIEVNIQMMACFPFGIYCAHLANLQSLPECWSCYPSI